MWLVFLLGWSTLSDAQIVCTYTASNDLCIDALPLDDTELATSTCCGNIEGINLCTVSETGVWYMYDQVQSATLVTIRNISISRGISVEFYSGDCGNLRLIQRSDCSGFEQRAFEVPNCDGQVFIHIATTENGCGEFTITAEDIAGCDFADTCDEISLDQILQPVADGAQVCVSSCLDYSCVSSCTDESVWFRFDTDDLTTAVQLLIENPEFDPLISVYRGLSCGDFDDLIVCQQLNAGEFLDISVTPDFTYFIEISLGNGSPGAFDLCINAIQDFIDCSSGEISVTRPENPMANPNGPYCPGETVVFCYDLEFFVDRPDEGNGCQWLQGIVPIVVGGWDLSVNNLQSQSPSNWNWYYNVDSPVLELTTDAGGNKILEYGPGGLQAGDILPGGWYFVSNGTNIGCTNDGHPDNMWGINTPCGTVFNFSHCFELTAKSISDISACDDEYTSDLSVTLFNFSDGETGCYTSLACSGDTPVKFEAQLDCSSLLEITSTDDEICSGDYASVPIGIEGNYEIPLEVRVIDAGNTSGAQDWIFETGSGLIPDQIFNNGSSIETIRYEVSFYNPETDCNTPVETFEVLVHPEFMVSMDTLHIICQGEEQMLEAPAGHDAYAWYDATSNELLSSNIIINTDTSGFYRVEVTEDFCVATEIIEVRVNTPLPPALAQTSLDVCNSYIGTLPSVVDLIGLQINGVEGIWRDEDDELVADASVVSFEGMAAGLYNYSFETSSAAAPCPDTSYVVSVNVEHCECPQINIIAPLDFCAIDQTFDLNNISATTESGSWSITAGPDINSIDIIGSNMFIDSDVVEGRYSLRFSLDDPDLAPLCPRDSTVEFYIFQRPVADIQPAGTACNIYTGTELDFVDLDDYNLSNSSGFWTSTDPSITIDADNIVSFTGEEPGDYLFSFNTNTANPPCLDQQYTTVITLLDCACPSLELSTIDDQCITDLQIDLNAFEITAEPGQWSLVSGSDISSIQIDNETLIISPSTLPGEYTIAYTLDLTDIPPLCDDSNQLSFNLNPPADVEIIAGTDLCNEFTGTLATGIDLDELITTNNSGTWSSASGLVIIDADNYVDFTSLPIQDYEFIFTTNDVLAPCSNEEYQTTVSLTDCSCPVLELSPLGDQCILPQTIDLQPLQMNSAAGEWSLQSGPGTDGIELNNTNLIIDTDAEPGIYTLR
jgi:hypothetical protein